MSILVIQLPPRERLTAQGSDAPVGLRLPAEWDFCFSADERGVGSSGRAAIALLPKAGRVMLRLADADLSWHRILIPKAPPARLRAALAGVLEEALLDDDEALHLALGPLAVPGQMGWVAATNKPRLLAALAALQAGGLLVERVLASSWPGAAADKAAASKAAGSSGRAEAGTAQGHFMTALDGDEARLCLVLSQASGVCSVELAGGLARALLPGPDVAVRWTATPAAAAQAEQWLGAPVALLGEPERALEALASGVNLRQFDLVAQHRGSLALREGLRRLLSPAWRPVRWGLVALVLMQVLGLNAWAWQQRQAVSDRKQAMTELLRNTHPGVRAVLDAPVQMQRETERLRAAAGRPGDGDLEVLLAAAAAAWPDDQGPVQSLRFEAGRLTLAAPGWSEPQMTQFRSRLASAGFGAERSEGRITVARSAS